ncbi:MAG: NAD(P)H-hydrate dehydratase [Bacilli bacterium]|jgi:NAD(P)H-hydrate epimerase|nr:NAD(P)H-hydrate dehydratase [Bacilli bacterium]
MKELFSVNQIKALDQVEGKKDDPLFLMEKAASGAYQALRKIKPFQSVLVVCGSGNNGGDGLALSRILSSKGYQVKTVLIKGHQSEENKKEEEKLPFKALSEIPEGSFNLVIDALYGIGFHEPLEEDKVELLKRLNSLKAYKVSLDIPSGLNGDNGKGKYYFKADLTLTFGAYKKGLFLNDGLDASGKITLVPIYKKKGKGSLNLIEKKDLKPYFSIRKRNSNKGDYPSLAILGGSLNYLGAPYLSYLALAGLRMGAGYIYEAIPEETYSYYALKAPQAIMIKMPSKDGHLSFEPEALDQLMKRTDAIGFGMGCLTSEDTYKIAVYLIRNFKGLLLIDADGLNALAKCGLSFLKEKRPGQLILTPHLKEFSRLLNKSVEEIEDKQVELAQEFSAEYHLNLILKSASSIITDGEKSFLNVSGNSGLAKGGSGDMLSGIIIGLSYLLKEGASCLDICKIGSYLLGRTAEIFALKLPSRALICEDVINLLPLALKEICPLKG